MFINRILRSVFFASCLFTFNAMALDEIELKALTESAESGHIDAQKKLSEYYLSSDSKKAVKWLTQAAEKGDAESAAVLGAIYYSGLLNIDANYPKAKALMGKACEQNFKSSCETYHAMKLEKPCRLVNMEVWLCG